MGALDPPTDLVSAPVKCPGIELTNYVVLLPPLPSIGEPVSTPTFGQVWGIPSNELLPGLCSLYKPERRKGTKAVTRWNDTYYLEEPANAASLIQKQVVCVCGFIQTV
jgi:hypothetical protein